MCVTYVTVLDALSADLRVQAIGMSVAAALSGTAATDLPTWDRVRESFDAELIAPPVGENATEDTPQAVMMRALGLR